MNSKDAKASVDVGSDAKREVARELLTVFAQALNGMLGDEGLTLQGIGIKLRPVPGFSEAMAEAKVTGVGALERLIWVFRTCSLWKARGRRSECGVVWLIEACGIHNSGNQLFQIVEIPSYFFFGGGGVVVKQKTGGHK